MDTANVWLNELPVNSRGRHMLTLDKARQIALVSPTMWCVRPYRMGYAIGKQTAYPEWDLYYVVNENNEPLCFDALAAAVEFLLSQLHVYQTILSLTPELIDAA